MSSNKKRRELNRAIEEHEIAKLASSSNNAFNAAVWKAGAEKLQADNDQLRSELTTIKAENESLKRDAERLDWMERKSEESRSGVTFQRVRYAEDGNVVESGCRVMSFHNVGELHQTLRVAIDAAMAQGEQK